MGPTNYSLTGPINASLVFNLELAGTPWYSRANYRKRANRSYEPSMQIPAGFVMESLEKQNMLDI